MTSWPSGHESRLSSGAHRKARYYLKNVTFSGFATFKNEGEGEVEIVGVGKEEGSADLSGGSGMILSTQDLQNCKTKSQFPLVIDDLNFQQHQI